MGGSLYRGGPGAVFRVGAGPGACLRGLELRDELNYRDGGENEDLQDPPGRVLVRGANDNT